MSGTFDPYLKWLGIRGERGRINHYRLLGLELFESDLEVIAGAAERQIRHVESFATTDHADMCKQVIAEIRQARDCLLDPKQRAAYDKKIGEAAYYPAAESGREQKSSAPQPSDSGPNFDFDLNADPGIDANSVSVNAPKIKTDANRRGRRRKSGAFDWAGWLLGALGAVAFAYVLVNTDLIDRIKGNASEDPIADIGDSDIAPKTESSELTPKAKPAPKSEPAKTENTDTGKTARDANPDRRNTNSNLPKIKDNQSADTTAGKNDRPKPRSPLKKLPVPDAAELKRANETIRGFHQAEIKSKDLLAKKVLAKTLTANFHNQNRPAMQYAALSLASELASKSGALDTLVTANQAMARLFEVDAWEQLEESAEDAISIANVLPDIAISLSDLLQDAREAEKFEFAGRLTRAASKLARNDGDLLQQDMLARYGKDMKGLQALRKRYEMQKGKDAAALSPKNKNTVGQYLCYGAGDWKQGLPLLAEGNDKTLALVAKTDMNSDGDAGGNSFESAQAWLNLSMKNKYKGYVRRSMLERAEEKLIDSQSLSLIHI